MYDLTEPNSQNKEIGRYITVNVKFVYLFVHVNICMYIGMYEHMYTLTYVCIDVLCVGT